MNRRGVSLKPVMNLEPTTYAIAAALVTGIRGHFGDRMIGIYAYGSAVYGDFLPGVSDLDTTAVLTEDANDADLTALGVLHDRLTWDFPEWEGRIEVHYIARDALMSFRERRSSMANISPGEPLHFIDMGIEWLVNWFFIGDHGVVLYGSPIDQVFPEVSIDEFVAAARDHARDWLGRLDDLDSSQGQSYAILTNSRALYTHRTGKQVSKERAAKWASEQFPDWKPAIDDALIWRQQPQFDASSTADRARSFVRSVVSLIDSETITIDNASK